MCFGCSKEMSRREGSFEYPQHMFWLRNNTKAKALLVIIFFYLLLFKSNKGTKPFSMHSSVLIG